MPSTNHSQKPGGRPKKHTTTAAAAEAKKESDKRRYLRGRQPPRPTNFIAYEPVLCADVPTETRTEIGIRTDADIPIPQDGEGQLSSNLLSVRANQQQLLAAFVANQGADTGTHAQANAEQEEYNAAILQRAEELDTGTLDNTITTPLRGEEDIITGLEAANEDGESRESQQELQRPCSRPRAFVASLPSADELVAWDNSGASSLHSSARSAGVQQPASRGLLETPKERSPPPSPQPSVGSSQRSTPFLAALSWMQSLIGSVPTPPLTSNSTLTGAATASLGLSSSTPSPPTSPPPPLPPPPPPPAVAAALPDPLEQTAFKLAKQLRQFQGCTHEQHDEADRLHQEHHQRPDVHSACSSLRQITTLFRGEYGDGTRLPDVLSSPRLMKPVDLRGVDCKGAFEGTSTVAFPEDVGTRDEHLPRNLCLSQHYSSSAKGRTPEVTFDIDSLCLFPSSLAVAYQGINWFPRSHPFLNLTADIHFGLEVPAYNHRGDLTEKFMPLHKISHYCFGTAVGMESLFIFIFFPALHLDGTHEHTTYLSHQDQELWYDAVLSPAIKKTVGCSNILQHYPASANIANLDSTALSAESLSRKDSSREQLLRYALQHQHLDQLWDCILQSIAENPGVARFAGATLFMHAKNTKLEHMDSSLPSAYGGWEACWSKVADPQFYNKDRTFVDLAKQITSEDSALPYDQIPDDHEAEVFLWKRCCLNAYA
jgi:hypothetical protein